MELLDFARAGVIAVIGFVVALLAARGTHRVALRYTDVQRAMIARRIVLFGLLALVVVSVMRELGYSLTVLLGGCPAARVGDHSLHGTPIAPGPGCPTVIIGG